MRKWIIGICVVVAMVSFFGAAKICHWSVTSMHFKPDEQHLLVRRGDTVGTVARQLHQQQDLAYPQLLTLYARISGLTNIKTGEYVLPEYLSPSRLLKKLIEGDVLVHQLTLVEGWTVRQVMQSLATNPNLTITLTDDAALNTWVSSLDLPGGSLEGWIFPDTYQFTWGMTDKDILLRAYQRTRNVLDEEWQAKAENLPYQSAYEALIMASIVEKETGVKQEREQIAGVFVRRLQKGMKLQTDPTVIYGLGADYQGNIRREHLRQPSPYNTYVIDGLPPTPIAMAGREAIHAALHPAAGDALYFVAKGDGSHQFSSTLEGHNRAVREYQIERRRQNYQSRPQAPTVEAAAESAQPDSAPDASLENGAAK